MTLRITRSKPFARIFKFIVQCPICKGSDTYATSPQSSGKTNERYEYHRWWRCMKCHWTFEKDL